MAEKYTIILSFTDLIETFSEFLVASIHTILNARALYPPETFIRTRKYNLEVPQSRLPTVCVWIEKACMAVQAELFRGVVRHIILIIYRQDTEDTEVVERWVFDVDCFPVVPEDSVLIDLVRLGSEKNISRVDIEEQLRATMGKLTYDGKKLATLPENCTYMVALEFKNQADPPMEVRFPLLSRE